MKRFLFVIWIAGLVGIAGLKGWSNDRYELEKSLSGYWHFKIGDSPEWARPDFDDSGWQEIRVPERWEEEGYPGYDGFAWYRCRFQVSEAFSERDLFLELGYIDDVDEVFLNGLKIGQTGTFPPHYSTAYNAFRKYRIPAGLVHFGGSNVLAVRVYDSQLEGGIVKGNIRVGAAEKSIRLDVDLCGSWNFSTGRKASSSGKTTLVVPGNWENQGFYDYDGYALYTRTFTLPASLSKTPMVFLAGRIDDYDQVWINETLIGQTGDYETRRQSDAYTEFRNYVVPPGVLKPGENQIEIRIYDRTGEGGIIEGAVGLVNQERFIRFWKEKRTNRNTL
ncbi:MAG TPA: beta galactosidase jelly roll domain-containing protein [Prolixibacteraceae bacterium]|nr:beta galactosidase jelly roll domain-containing protein [Prolixibacteraceae bacterium]